MQSEGVEKAERYRSGGLFSGLFGWAVIVALLGYGLFSEDDGLAPWAYPALLLLAVLIWVVLLRPAVVLHADELELRNMLHSRFVPYVRITSVQIDLVTTVLVDEVKYVGSGFGRSRRVINRDAKAGPSAPSGQHSLGWLVEEKIHRRMHPHDAVTDPAPVRRAWALPEIVALAVLTVVTLVTMLVA